MFAFFSRLPVFHSAHGGFSSFWVTCYCLTTENPTELRPKSIMGGQLNESIFLLRYVQEAWSPSGFPPFFLLGDREWKGSLPQPIDVKLSVFSSSRPTPRTSAMVELNPGEGEDPSSPQKTSPLSKVSSHGTYVTL